MTRLMLAAGLAVLVSLSPLHAADTFDSVPTRSLTRDDMAAFLRTASIVKARPIGKGVTRPMRLTLSDGSRTHDAAFQSVNAANNLQAMSRGVRPNGEFQFVDAYRYNVAAYEVAGVLGLAHMMPVTVERVVNGRRGALTWWVDVLMDEAERESRGIEPPDRGDFYRQRQRMVVFGELVRDTDRNQGNVLYTPDWRVVMIDFTRAFRLHGDLRVPASLQRCDRQLLARLRSLTRDELEAAAGRHLTGFEMDAVMKRRDRIVQHFETIIAQRGEDAVLY